MGKHLTHPCIKVLNFLQELELFLSTSSFHSYVTHYHKELLTGIK